MNSSYIWLEKSHSKLYILKCWAYFWTVPSWIHQILFRGTKLLNGYLNNQKITVKNFWLLEIFLYLFNSLYWFLFSKTLSVLCLSLILVVVELIYPVKDWLCQRSPFNWNSVREFDLITSYIIVINAQKVFG